MEAITFCLYIYKWELPDSGISLYKSGTKYATRKLEEPCKSWNTDAFQKLFQKFLCRKVCIIQGFKTACASCAHHAFFLLCSCFCCVYCVLERARARARACACVRVCTGNCGCSRRCRVDIMKRLEIFVNTGKHWNFDSKICPREQN